MLSYFLRIFASLFNDLMFMKYILNTLFVLSHRVKSQLQFIQFSFSSLVIILVVGCGSFKSKNASQGLEVDPLVNVSPQFRLAFYNLENLFDTIDGPNDDAEFLPNGKNQWNSDRYQKKLVNMSRVIDSIRPDILGVCEVENAAVLFDLMKKSALCKFGSSSNPYQLVHRESPDARGIDVALIYNLKKFKQTGVYEIPVKLHDNHATRNILAVHLFNYQSNDSLVVFVNHWPSRSQGEEKSRVNRISAALALSGYLETKSNLPTNWAAVGDFNDNPSDSSLLNCLKAGNEYASAVNLAYMYRINNPELGSLKYNGKWDLFDQIILSRSLYHINSHYGIPQQQIYNRSFLIQADGRFVGYPFRTYGGKTFLNGFSDHLPVYTDMQMVDKH